LDPEPEHSDLICINLFSPGSRGVEFAAELRDRAGEVPIPVAAAAYRCGESLTLLVVDLDDFKQIDNRHGHSTGDQVLREVGALLREQMRSDERVVRFGGEEFVIVLTNSSKWRALRRAEPIRERIGELGPAGPRVSASTGVAHSAEPAALDFDGRFRATDKAVYRAKQRGRDSVSFRRVARPPASRASAG
jgi:diguanylate cyclase (GGDEF)-like protein